MTHKTHLQHRRAEIRKVLRAGAGKTIGMAWYTRESWQRLMEVADDRGTGHDTFEEWERQASAGTRQLAAAGTNVCKVFIDIDALVAWCRDRGREVNSAARAEFTALQLQQQQRSRAGDTDTS